MHKVDCKEETTSLDVNMLYMRVLVADSNSCNVVNKMIKATQASEGAALEAT
jgi:hypothetical protein